ncbi:hypothetical protein SNK04_014048 [Fusarium graminearum]
MAVVEKRGKKWRAMVRIKPHPTASKTFNGRKAAEDWARITEDALRAGLPPPQESMTLEALIDRYIKEMDRFAGLRHQAREPPQVGREPG